LKKKEYDQKNVRTHEIFGYFQSWIYEINKNKMLMLIQS